MFGDTTEALLLLLSFVIFVNYSCREEEKTNKVFSLLRFFKDGTSVWILTTTPPFDLNEYL